MCVCETDNLNLLEIFRINKVAPKPKIYLAEQPDITISFFYSLTF